MNTLIRVEIAPKRSAAECVKTARLKCSLTLPSVVQAAFAPDQAGGKTVPDIDACPGTASGPDRHPQVKDWSRTLLIAICV